MFGWKKKAPGLLPDIKRRRLSDEEFAEWDEVLTEYGARREGERFALCLEGGGAKGRWQAGFLARAAEVRLLDLVDIGAGASVGGLNALMVARYLPESPDLQELVDVWRGIRENKDVYLGELPTDFWSAVRGVMAGKLKRNGWLDVSPLRELVRKHLEGYHDALGAFEVHVTAANALTRSLSILGPRYAATDRALATSAVPGAFPVHEVAGFGFMDGGTMMNCPYPFLLGPSVQATKLLVLYCDPDPEHVSPRLHPMTTIHTLADALACLMQVQSDRAYSDLDSIAQLRRLQGLSEVEIQHYYPSRETGGLLDFGAGHDLLQLGYDDAVKYLTPAKVRELLRP